jgi:DNA-binding response OmpR family regulator
MAIIMVVDDDATTRVLLRRGFERAAFTVIEANDGLDACDLAVSARPDIILIDWDMLKMDGREATLWLKAHAATANIPILMLTSHMEPSFRATALEAGVLDFLEKPFRIKDIVTHVERCLRSSLR